jgi:hypothetical protein
MIINIAPVIFLVQYSTSVTLLKRELMFFMPNAMATANMRTGRPVPAPYTEGKSIGELWLRDNGIKLPKNKAAEEGQKDKANSTPNGKDPIMPRLFNRPATFAENEKPENVNLNSPRRNNPVTIKTGPSIWFIFF